MDNSNNDKVNFLGNIFKQRGVPSSASHPFAAAITAYAQIN